MDEKQPGPLVLERVVLDSMADHVAVLDPTGTIVSVNAAWRDHALKAGCEDCAEGVNFLEVCRRATGDAAADAARAAAGVSEVLTGTTSSFAMDLRCAGAGQTRWFSQLVVPLTGDDGGAVLTYSDITARKQVEDQTRRHATHDLLTGLPNRTLIYDRLQQALAGLRREQTSVALMFLDVDDFKTVNDAYGHAAGDEVLTSIAMRLRRCVRPTDTVGRLGGDEFVIVCSADPADRAARQIAARIARAMSMPIHVGGRRLRISVSIGMHVTDQPEDRPEELLHLADLSMFRAKQGRRQVVDVTGEAVSVQVSVGSTRTDGRVVDLREQGVAPMDQAPKVVRDLSAGGQEGFNALDDGYAGSVQRLLHLVRRHLDMEIAWTSEFVGNEQVFRFVDAAPGVEGPAPGTALPLSGAYCDGVLNGDMPAIIPDTRADAHAALLPVTAEMRIGSYLGVPLHGPDGETAGMLCAVSSTTRPALSERDRTTARLVADVIEDLHGRALSGAESRRRRADLHDALLALCAGRGRHPVLQPIVDVRSGLAVAAEALTRFDSLERDAAQWFAAATHAGLGRRLEVAAAQSALEHVRDDTVLMAIAVNLSPQVIVEGGVLELLPGNDPSRLIVEITEHAPVDSYDDLVTALRPHRDQGVRIAIDDAGAGYSSMTHVLQLQPDFVKVDMSLVRGIDADPVRQALVSAIATFASHLSATVVAEGVETLAELRQLHSIGVEHAQGYLFGAPSRRPVLSGYPTAVS